MLKIIILLMTLCFAKVEGEKINRAELKKTIFKGCMEMSSAVADQKQKICTCLVRNFDKKANDYQLKLLAENYANKEEASATDPDIISSAVQTFDDDVATECVKNPDWNIK